jgi:signal peptidase I
VVINDGVITIYSPDHVDGAKLDESQYLSSSVQTFGNIDITLTTAQYYVLGDNRPASLDSRSFGPIPRTDIVGRTAVRAWPVSKAKTFSTPQISLTSVTL